MDARQIIENQQELIDLQRAEIKRKEAEIDAAYEMVIKIAQAVLNDNFGSAPSKFGAEQAFRRLIDKRGLKTDYQFTQKSFQKPIDWGKV